jgi:glycosyltransferase involved in cell wall biosynthesis
VSGSDSIAILQIIPRLDTGGAEISTVEMTEAITGAGGQALVATEGGRMAGEIEQLGGTVIEFPAATKNPARIIANGKALAQLVRERNVRIVHARSRAPAWSALLAARLTGVPLVTTYHGGYSGTRGPKLWYNSVMTRGAIVIANSNYTADIIRTRYGVDERKLRIIDRGVDLRRFIPDQVSQERQQNLRLSWGVTADQPVILHAARLTSWKGQHIVVEAARMLKESSALGDAVIVMVGDAQGRDEYRAEIAHQIDTAGLTDRVLLVGHCDDMAAAAKLATVTLIASTKAEGFGRTSVEALAMGCPVIATRIGAPPDTLIADANLPLEQRIGWIVEPGDPLSLAAAIRAVLSVPAATRQIMGERARRHVVENFSALRMQLATLAVYDELLGTTLATTYALARTQADTALAALTPAPATRTAPAEPSAVSSA